MNSILKTAAAMVVGLTLGAPLLAGPLVDKATEAENLLRSGDPAGALLRMDEAMAMAWEVGPLYVKKALYVDDASGYGVYTERPQGSTFRPDEKLLIYAEPVGFGYGQLAPGLFEFGFDVDFQLANKGGEVIASNQDFMAVDLSAREKVREFYLKITLSFEGLSVGTYDLFLRLRDQNSEKYAVFQMPLTVVE